jgi:hypothetical protein
MTGFISKRKMAQDKEALKLALIIEEFDGNDESLPLELLKPIAETLRALAQPAQEQWLQDVSIKIEAALLSHRLSLHNDSDDAGNGFPLVDALCCGQPTLDIGKREVEDIVEAIYHVLDANTRPPPAAQPEQEALYGMNQDDWKDVVAAITKVRDGRGIYLACRPTDVFQDWFLALGTAKVKEKNT